jgi:predicted RNA-binding Zn-ribbon protein involved in translation (DUF1610 family)
MRLGDRVIILCKSTKELENPGCDATVGNCWKCGVEIWVGPNSRRRMREFNAQIYCTSCGIEITKDNEHAIIGTANQLESLNKDALRQGAVIFPVVKLEDADEILRRRDKFGGESTSAS